MLAEISHRFTCNDFEGSYKAAMNERDVALFQIYLKIIELSL